MKPASKIVHGQPAWRIATPQVEAFITQTGGHLAPVTFNVDGKKIRPYSIPPWAGEKLDRSIPPILRILRGDFFCLPFGGNTTPFQGQMYPVHGETANAKWKLEEANRTALHLSLKTKLRPGQVDKRISLIKGHNALYCRHTISGMSGSMPLGHHATLKFPDAPGSGVISTSPFLFGQTFYEPTENPESRGYSILKPAAEFGSLKRVPMISGETTDLSRYPARRGYEDIVMVIADPKLPFAWTAATFAKERYVWFAIKDPRVLRGTVFWMSNGGRHYAPWNGRHVNVIGLEEVTANFHYGLAESVAENPLSRRDYPTAVKLDPHHPTTVNYIMAVAAIPAGFDEVKTVEPTRDGVTLTSASGKSISAPLDLNFINGVA